MILDHEFLNARRRELEVWLRGLMHRNEIVNCHEFVNFLSVPDESKFLKTVTKTAELTEPCPIAENSIDTSRGYIGLLLHDHSTVSNVQRSFINIRRSIADKAAAMHGSPPPVRTTTVSCISLWHQGISRLSQICRIPFTHSVRSFSLSAIRAKHFLPIPIASRIPMAATSTPAECIKAMGPDHFLSPLTDVVPETDLHPNKAVPAVFSATKHGVEAHIFSHITETWASCTSTVLSHQPHAGPKGCIAVSPIALPYHDCMGLLSVSSNNELTLMEVRSGGRVLATSRLSSSPLKNVPIVLLPLSSSASLTQSAALCDNPSLRTTPDTPQQFLVLVAVSTGTIDVHSILFTPFNPPSESSAATDTGMRTSIRALSSHPGGGVASLLASQSSTSTVASPANVWGAVSTGWRCSMTILTPLPKMSNESVSCMQYLSCLSAVVVGYTDGRVSLFSVDNLESLTVDYTDAPPLRLVSSISGPLHAVRSIEALGRPYPHHLVVGCAKGNITVFSILDGRTVLSWPAHCSASGVSNMIGKGPKSTWSSIPLLGSILGGGRRAPPTEIEEVGSGFFEVSGLYWNDLQKRLLSSGGDGRLRVWDVVGVNLDVCRLPYGGGTINSFGEGEYKDSGALSEANKESGFVSRDNAEVSKVDGTVFMSRNVIDMFDDFQLDNIHNANGTVHKYQNNEETMETNMKVNQVTQNNSSQQQYYDDIVDVIEDDGIVNEDEFVGFEELMKTHLSHVTPQDEHVSGNTSNIPTSEIINEQAISSNLDSFNQPAHDYHQKEVKEIQETIITQQQPQQQQQQQQQIDIVSSTSILKDKEETITDDKMTAIDENENVCTPILYEVHLTTDGMDPYVQGGLDGPSWPKF